MEKEVENYMDKTVDSFAGCRIVSYSKGWPESSMFVHDVV